MAPLKLLLFLVVVECVLGISSTKTHVCMYVCDIYIYIYIYIYI